MSVVERYQYLNKKVGQAESELTSLKAVEQEKKIQLGKLKKELKGEHGILSLKALKVKIETLEESIDEKLSSVESVLNVAQGSEEAEEEFDL